MKRIIIISVVVGAILLTSSIVAFAVDAYKESVNKENLNQMVGKFEEELENFEGVQIVEKQAVYGKLNGNGNGIQYFGAFLLENDSNVDWDGIEKKLDEEFELIERIELTSSDIYSKYLEHQELRFQTNIDQENKNEYIVYCFFNSRSLNDDLNDIEGH